MHASRVSVFLFLFVAGSAAAQTQNAGQLPAGLSQQGGVIMMAPIDSGLDTGSTVSSEHRQSAQHVLSASDHDLYTRAFDAGDHGDWIGARGLAGQGHDAIARRLVEWRYLLDQNSGASFGEIDAFLKANPSWPLRGTLFMRAEQAMDPAMASAAVIAWFGDRTPSTGIGMVRLGEALIATGKTTAGRDYVIRGWTGFSFKPEQEIAIARAHGDIFTPEVDKRRLNDLLWRDDIASAKRQLSRVGPGVDAIADARIALRSNPATGRRLASNLSAYAQKDAGLLYDLARTDRRGAQYDEAEALLMRVPRDAAAVYPKAWWNELNIAAREAIKDHNYHMAYSLAADTGLTSGTEFAEAEFLAGWVALRYLKSPKTAMIHFQKLDTGVSRPISRARAHYWEGRAAEDGGDIATAWQNYRLAAQDSDTYYGEIALARIDATPTLHVKDVSIDASAARDDFEKEDLTRAMRILGDLGEVNLLRTFAAFDADQSPEPKHTVLLMQALSDMGFREIALRVAKAASYNGLPVLKYSHPVIAIPSYPGPGNAPEPALILGLIRQETEFDPTSVSGPGAAGIMQMMPASARKAASQAGLPYRPGALTTDVTYNMQLGMTEIGSDLVQWNGSYILAAAAYNAGPNNAEKWIVDYGDPRSPNVDPIDWVETIPFSETRNYVQRVLENTQVYRTRLSGGDQPLRIMADLSRPNPPQVKVLAYTPPPPAAALDIVPKRKPH